MSPLHTNVLLKVPFATRTYCHRSWTMLQGLPRFVAREKVLNELSHRAMLRKVCGCKTSVPICSRSRDVVEYILKEQWFVKCKDMAEKAMQAVKENRLKIVPGTHEQLWYDSLSNIR